MELDVVIDVVCPWCFVGKRQLDRALKARPGAVSEVRYRPYQLSPDTPPEGVDRNAYYEKKFGDSPQFRAARQQLMELGEDLGIKFDFTSECRIANTLDAHRLLRWALGADVQDAVAEGLMRAYFEDCKFLGDHGLLVEIASDAGMDAALVGELLASDRDKALIVREITLAQEAGIRGVPMFVFAGKGALSGAQGADTLIRAIDQLKAA